MTHVGGHPGSTWCFHRCAEGRCWFLLLWNSPQTPHADTGESAAVGRSCLFALTTSWLFLILEASTTLPCSVAVSLPPLQGEGSAEEISRLELVAQPELQLRLVQHLKLKDDLELKQTALISKDHTSIDFMCKRPPLVSRHQRRACSGALLNVGACLCLGLCVCAG